MGLEDGHVGSDAGVGVVSPAGGASLLSGMAASVEGAPKLAETRQKRLSAIKALPQSGAIREQDILPWLARVEAVDPDRADWHVARAGGFGGSDIGVLVEARRGVYNHRTSAHAIVGEKLLMFSPRRPSAAMRRGVALEPLVKKMFEEQFGAIDLTSSLGNGVHPAYPWMRYSPDVYCQLPGGEFALVDFKSTHDDTVKAYERSGEVDLSYACQLHHGAQWIRSQGLRVDHLLLVSQNFEKWDLDVRAVAENPDVHDEIIAAGNHYWERHVLTGVLPPAIAKQEIQLTEEMLSDVRQSSDRVLALRLAAKAVEDELNQWQAKLESTVGTFELGEARLSVSGVAITAKSKINEGAVRDRLEAVGVSADQFTSKGGIDPEKAEALLVKLGHDSDCRVDVTDWAAALSYLDDVGLTVPQCRTEGLSVRVSTKKSGPEAQIVQECRAEVKEFVQRIVEWSDPKAAWNMPEADPESAGALAAAPGTSIEGAVAVEANSARKPNPF